MSKLNIGDINLFDWTNDKEQQQSADQQSSVTLTDAVTLRKSNTLCPKGRQLVRPRSRSYSTPGDRSRCNDSDFFFAPHLDLDRQMLFHPKKVEVEDDEDDNEQSLDESEHQDVEE